MHTIVLTDEQLLYLNTSIVCGEYALYVGGEYAFYVEGGYLYSTRSTLSLLLIFLLPFSSTTFTGPADEGFLLDNIGKQWFQYERRVRLK